MLWRKENFAKKQNKKTKQKNLWKLNVLSTKISYEKKIVQKTEKSNYDTTLNVTNLINVNCDNSKYYKTLKIKLWQNWKNHVVINSKFLIMTKLNNRFLKTKTKQN